MEAVQHALAAGDLDLLAMCLADGWFELIARTDTAFRSDVLARISETDVDSSAQLSAVLASVDFISGQTRSGVAAARARAEASAEDAVAFAPGGADLRGASALHEPRLVPQDGAPRTQAARARRGRAALVAGGRDDARDRARASRARGGRARPGAGGGGPSDRGARGRRGSPTFRTRSSRASAASPGSS